jgi:hypothetical protein
MHAPYTNPNNHIVIVPPPVIAFIPQLQIAQFKAKKNTYIIVSTNNPNCDNLDVNIEAVIITVSVAYTPETNADDESEEVEVKVCAKASAQK